VQIGRRADVNNVQLAISDQVAKAAVDRRYLMPSGKIQNTITPRRDGFDINIDAIDSPVGMHVQLRNEAASRQADCNFPHF
jgi:hypothetical protein